MQRPRKFCECQEICKEDEGKGTYTCLGNLAEGRAFECSYKESDIKVMDECGNGKYRFKIQKNPKPNADGICRAFEITAEIKKDLIARVVSELEKS